MQVTCELLSFCDFHMIRFKLCNHNYFIGRRNLGERFTSLKHAWEKHVEFDLLNNLFDRSGEQNAGD